jgi:hypothetical protein
MASTSWSRRSWPRRLRGLPSSPFTIVVRRRGKPDKRAFATLDEALDALETELRADATQLRRAPREERALGRSYEPAEQVATRGELRGPGRLRVGVDVRGDGSFQPWTGVVRRRLIEVSDREDAWSALRREVGLPAR